MEKPPRESKLLTSKRCRQIMEQYPALHAEPRYRCARGDEGVSIGVGWFVHVERADAQDGTEQSPR